MNDGSEREQNARVRERFTRTAEAFARLSASTREGEGEILAQLAGAQPEDTVLDLACGPGTFTIPLARRVRRVFGLDLTPAFLGLARKRAAQEGLGNVSFLCADATGIPIRDESIHVAVCGYSFHHMKQPLRALREMARVLAPGGRLAVVDIYTPEGFDPGINDRIEQARDDSHCHTFAQSEFGRTVEQAGFRIHAKKSQESPRIFSEWMRTAGWEPGDAAWRETRRMMEDELADDASGLHPRIATAAGQPEPEIEFTQSILFIEAAKS